LQGHQLPGPAAYEIIAFTAKANTKPIGTKVVRFFANNGTNIDIGTLGLLSPSLREWSGHSFQFHVDAATTSQLWKRVVVESGIATVLASGAFCHESSFAYCCRECNDHYLGWIPASGAAGRIT
jgi:hypothetical protein